MYRTVRRTQPVEVERDGRWYAGELQAWRKVTTARGWRSSCTASRRGMRYLEWGPVERVRQGEGPIGVLTGESRG